MEKPLRPCRYPGCRRLTKGGYCAEHKPEERRGESKKWHGMYNLSAWKKLRRTVLYEEPFCRECAKAGLRVAATEVDHILPHRGNIALFLSRENLQGLCHTCHSRKTMKELNFERKPKKT